jgi:hypothetical protein
VPGAAMCRYLTPEATAGGGDGDSHVSRGPSQLSPPTTWRRCPLPCLAVTPSSWEPRTSAAAAAAGLLADQPCSDSSNLGMALVAKWIGSDHSFVRRDMILLLLAGANMPFPFLFFSRTEAHRMRIFILCIYIYMIFFIYSESSHPRNFLKKGLKKLKFEKGVPVGNNSKNGCLPPVDRAGCVGPGTPRPSIGFQKYFQTPPKGLFANRKVS